MSDWNNAVDVVRRCLAAGVAEFVVCAGARNALLLEALARAEAAGKAKVWRHFEERSAGFFALGRTLDSAAPCAVVTTSGTAAAELLPAIIEARYQMRPLLAITADRPAEFRFSGAPQAIDQVGIFGGYAANCAIEAWDGFGPLHWNFECGEGFAPDADSLAELPVKVFSTRREPVGVAELARWLREDVFKGLVVMIGGLEPDEREEVFHFCLQLAVPVVADATSGLREALQELQLHDAERVLAAHPPGKVLRLGDVPSGRFWRDLENLPQIEVWSVCRSGLPGLARASKVTKGVLNRILPSLGDIDPIEDVLDHLVGNSRRAAHIDELLEAYPDSEPSLLRALSHYASLGSGVYLGNSLPIREWNRFAQWGRPVPEVRANRGANGIDGQLSSWLGWSADQEDSWAVVGDLTALYDVAAGFMLEQVVTRGRVLVVINNQGGGIFKQLPRLAEMQPRAAECVINPHHADLSGISKLWGIRHLCIRSQDDLDAFEPGEGMTLLEVLPDEEQTQRFWNALGR